MQTPPWCRQRPPAGVGPGAGAAPGLWLCICPPGWAAEVPEAAAEIQAISVVTETSILGSAPAPSVPVPILKVGNWGGGPRTAAVLDGCEEGTGRCCLSASGQLQSADAGPGRRGRSGWAVCGAASHRPRAEVAGSPHPCPPRASCDGRLLGGVYVCSGTAPLSRLPAPGSVNAWAQGKGCSHILATLLPSGHFWVQGLLFPSAGAVSFC